MANRITRSEWKSRALTAEAEVAELAADAVAAETQIDGLNGLIVGLLSKLDECEATRASLTAEVAAGDAEITGLNAEIAALQSKLAACEAKLPPPPRGSSPK